MMINKEKYYNILDECKEKITVVIKDRFGNEINIGDTVVFVNKSRYSQLDYGIVTDLKKNDKVEIFYMKLGYYEKLPSKDEKDIITVEGGLFTSYTTRESRNLSVIKNIQLQIKENK